MLNHPWRAATFGGSSLDPVANTRSSEFAAYLETLPREERQQIERAERAFVTKSNINSSPVARDYAEGMLGIKEYEPAGYRGFVV